MAGLPLREGALNSLPVQGFSGPSHPDYRVPVSGQGTGDLQGNRPYGDLDVDMADTAAAPRTAEDKAASPEDASNEEDSNETTQETELKTKTVAIPEYFANGKIPKKRGPKPDSKPARDRRQELNRQAQRNHRQRKENNQKMLEEALAEATEKTCTAMKRLRAAEELQQRVHRGQEHLVRENERLKQLLDVNNIPYEHVIPQQDAQNVDPIQPNNSTLRRDDLILRSMASQGTTIKKCVTIPPTNAAVPPTSASTALPTYAKSSPGDVTLSGVSLGSSSSPVFPIDNANRTTKGGSGSESRAYNPIPSGHQPILNIGQTLDALTGQPSGPLLGQAPGAASASSGPVRHNFSVTPSISSYHESSNATLGALHPSSSINTNEVFMDSSDDTSFTPVPSRDPFAIPDHDQAGAEFILALEANCHDHKTLMNARTFNDPVQLGGHSLMLTKVPINVAKEYRLGDAPHPHELPDVGEGPGKYARMLGLVSLKPYSTTKNWTVQTGEISAAQALGMVRKDPRYPMLKARDFAKLTNELKDRCRCYGFGAVVEVYEVQDALDEILTEKGYGLVHGYDLDHPFWSRIPLSNPHTLNGPEFPALDGLMDFDIAALMRDRHSEREQFLAADLSTFNFPIPNVGHPTENGLSHDSQSASIAPPSFPTPGFPQMSTSNFEPPITIGQSTHSQVTSGARDTYQYILS